MQYMSVSYLRRCISYASETGIPVLVAFEITEAQLQDDNYCIDVARWMLGLCAWI